MLTVQVKALDLLYSYCIVMYMYVMYILCILLYSYFALTIRNAKIQFKQKKWKQNSLSSTCKLMPNKIIRGLRREEML